MSWSDPDERPRPAGFGGDWRGARASFDDPMSWSLPVARIAGITVRVHLFFLAFVLASLARSASPGADASIAWKPTLLGLGALLAIIVLHEFGHCIACRRSGGRADEILLWPLGGLAGCVPPERPGAHLWTALGGPLVNVAIVAVLTPVLGLRTGEWLGVAVPNPFGLASLVQDRDVSGWLELLLVLANYIAWVLLIFNLIPMFPLDGGRILQAILWRRRGYAASMRIACRAGFVAAVALGIAALATDGTTLLAIAIFGGFVSVATLRQVDAERDFLGFDPDPAELAAVEEEEEFDAGPPRRIAGRGAAGAQAVGASGPDSATKEAEIDRILEKIAKGGMAGLSDAEREFLRRATDEKRGTGDPRER